MCIFKWWIKESRWPRIYISIYYKHYGIADDVITTGVIRCFGWSRYVKWSMPTTAEWFCSHDQNKHATTPPPLSLYRHKSRPVSIVSHSLDPSWYQCIELYCGQQTTAEMKLADRDLPTLFLIRHHVWWFHCLKRPSIFRSAYLSAKHNKHPVCRNGRFFFFFTEPRLVYGPTSVSPATRSTLPKICRRYLRSALNPREPRPDRKKQSRRWFLPR